MSSKLEILRFPMTCNYTKICMRVWLIKIKEKSSSWVNLRQNAKSTTTLWKSFSQHLKPTPNWENCTYSSSIQREMKKSSTQNTTRSWTNLEKWMVRLRSSLWSLPRSRRKSSILTYFSRKSANYSNQRSTTTLLRSFLPSRWIKCRIIWLSWGQ